MAKGGAQISSLHLAIAATGGVLIYAAVQGVSPLEAVRQVTSGTPAPVVSKSSSVGTTTAGASQAMYPGTGVSSNSLVTAARSYLGVPYKWGGTSRDGLDCSGLTYLSIRDAYGVTPPRTTYGQEPWGQLASVKAADIQPGDLVFWPGHVAIYTGNGQVIHAPRPGKVVEYAALSSAGPAGVKVSSYKRFKGTGSTTTTKPGTVISI